MLTLLNAKKHISYYVNENRSIFYTYNKKKKKVDLTVSNKFGSTTLKVITKYEDVVDMPLDAILKEDNDFVEVVNVIASTTKKPGNFPIVSSDTNLTTNYLNIYLNASMFIKASKHNHYNIKEEKNIIDLLKSETPSIYALLHNLFHNEKDEVILNFMRYLNKIAFQDNRQDIMFLFMGTAENKQGQGAGKGVLRDLLGILFSDLIVSVSNETYADKFNSELLNKKVVIFDEVDPKGLKYAKLKDITGSSTIRVENKGKDALTVDNVSSWLLFTNESNLHGKIKKDDRRTFIVNPNPISNSLKKCVIEPFFNGDFGLYWDSLQAELESFTHIISLASAKVLTPIELKTFAHSQYFNDDNLYLRDIKSIDDIFLKAPQKKSSSSSSMTY